MSENNLILRNENVALITQSAPRTYDENALSCKRCSDYGQSLLEEIKRHGMNDDLDKRCADYIEKAKRTLKNMNEKRSPYTKLFDQIRSAFTSMENAIDVAKKDTAPYLIQQARNAFASKKREELERQRQERLRMQQREQAINRYMQESEDDYRRQFDQKVTADINALTSLNQALTLENYDNLSTQIREFPDILPNQWFQKLPTFVHRPFEISEDEATSIQRETLNRISKSLKEQYQAEIAEYRDTIIDSLRSKKIELERMAKASAEEQTRLKAELEAREAAEARRLDQERKRREKEANEAKHAQAQAAEMDGLFGMAAVASPQEYQPKTSVRQRIVVDNADGYLAVLSLWWAKEGKHLSNEELAKMFKKQITFCEKLANDKENPEHIKSPFVHYQEEIKAK